MYKKDKVYCYRCRKFHPVNFEVDEETLYTEHGDWCCPKCGTSIRTMYEDISQLKGSEQCFGYPHRKHWAGSKDLFSWIDYRSHTSRHPILTRILLTGLLVLGIIALIPIVYFASMLLVGLLIMTLFIPFGLLIAIMCAGPGDWW